MDQKDHEDPPVPRETQNGGQPPSRVGKVLTSNTTRMVPISDSRTQSITPENGGPTLVEPPHAAASPVEVWVHRSWIVMYVVFCIWIGIIVTALPWFNSGRAFTDNAFAMAHPGLRSVLQMNFVRGVVSGVGLLNIWLGVWEAVHYRETKP